MKYLKISNDGILDIRLVALMGGTTKSGQKFKIGQFGTGLKYTLAFLFRNNIHFRIFAGEKEMIITTDEEQIGEEIFEIICINGHRTSITTKMGQDWDAWMIIRELWCNALDEGGSCREITSDVQGEEGTTIFYVQVDSKIQDVLDNWEKYFIHSQQPLSSTMLYDIYPGGNSMRLYKNGILIMEVLNTKSLFSYDVKQATLNELREFKGHLGYEISHALFGANEKVASYFLEHCTEDYYEGDASMTYDWYGDQFGEAWKTVIGSAKLIHPAAMKTIQDRGVTEGIDHFVVVPEVVYKGLTRQFAHVSALLVSSKVGEFFPDFNADSQLMIQKGLVILEQAGYPMNPELEFVYGYFSAKDTIARVDTREKKIYISNTVLQQSLTEIVCTLVEENEHFNTGFNDCSRNFQDHFIKLYVRQLLMAGGVEI